MAEQEVKIHYVGDAKIIGQQNQGMKINICLTDLRAALQDPEVQKLIFKSEKTGNEYIDLVAFPRKNPTGYNTHYVKVAEPYTPTAGATSFGTPSAAPAANSSPTSGPSDDLPF